MRRLVYCKQKEALAIGRDMANRANKTVYVLEDADGDGYYICTYDDQPANALIASVEIVRPEAGDAMPPVRARG